MKEALQDMAWASEPDMGDVVDSGLGTGGRASIAARWVRQTRLPVGEQKQAPLHSQPIGEADVPAIRKRMTPERQKRFDDVWHATFFGPLPQDPKTPQLVFTDEHADKLCADGIATSKLSKRKTAAWIEAFTTWEDKGGALGRQRAIMWTRIANRVLKDTYTPDVPLQHVSAYLEAALSELGGTRDMQTGFFQIPIPEEARHRFRFRDASGRVFELLRLPMGHRCSPELCQILLSTLAGLPGYALPAFQHSPEVKVNIWIDNVHAHGSVMNVEEYFAWLDVQARTCKITWKPSDSKVGKKVEFIGVQFNHANHTVCCKTKLIDKVAGTAEKKDAATIADIESHCGRLLHASSILGVNPARYYFFLKILRRRLAMVNKGATSRGGLAALPPCARSQLTAWEKQVCLNEPRRIGATKTHGRDYVLFTDSSEAGWGGVLVDLRTGQVRVAGGSWGHRATNISPGEVRAITCSTMAFADILRGTQAEQLLVMVDNTSAIASAEAKGSKSYAMNEEILRLERWLAVLGLSVTYAYVPSRYNLSDGPSRKKPIGQWFDVRGASGAAAAPASAMG